MLAVGSGRLPGDARQALTETPNKAKGSVETGPLACGQLPQWVIDRMTAEDQQNIRRSMSIALAALALSTLSFFGFIDRLLK